MDGGGPFTEWLHRSGFAVIVLLQEGDATVGGVRDVMEMDRGRGGIKQ